jgi:hypothetical protein
MRRRSCEPSRQPKVLSLVLACAAILGCAAAGCRKAAALVTAPDAFPEARVADVSRGCLELEAKAGALLLSLEKDGSGLAELKAVNAAELSPAPKRLPWALAPSFGFLSVAQGRVFAAINRAGVLILEEGGKGSLRWTLARDPELFGSRSVVSAWCRQGRYYLFLARSDAFEGGAADSRLISIAPQEFRFRVGTAVDPSAFLPGEELAYFNPIDSDYALAQLRKTEGEKTEIAYLRVALDDGRAERVSKAVYLAGFNFSRAAELAPGLSALCDPLQALERYPEHGSDFFVYLWSGSTSRVEERAYALSGSQDSEWSATLSAWEDGPSMAVLYPDGRLKLSRGGASEEARLPALPYAFDYDRVALAGGLAAASWSESVYPDTGRAGLALYRAD